MVESHLPFKNGEPFIVPYTGVTLESEELLDGLGEPTRSHYMLPLSAGP